MRVSLDLTVGLLLFSSVNAYVVPSRRVGAAYVVPSRRIGAAVRKKHRTIVLPPYMAGHVSF
jgi:hypothetical protein